MSNNNDDVASERQKQNWDLLNKLLRSGDRSDDFQLSPLEGEILKRLEDIMIDGRGREYHRLYYQLDIPPSFERGQYDGYIPPEFGLYCEKLILAYSSKVGKQQP